jgi:hypothetical protein
MLVRDRKRLARVEDIIYGQFYRALGTRGCEYVGIKYKGNKCLAIMNDDGEEGDDNIVIEDVQHLIDFGWNFEEMYQSELEGR